MCTKSGVWTSNSAILLSINLGCGQTVHHLTRINGVHDTSSQSTSTPPERLTDVFLPDLLHTVIFLQCEIRNDLSISYEQLLFDS